MAEENQDGEEIVYLAGVRVQVREEQVEKDEAEMYVGMQSEKDRGRLVWIVTVSGVGVAHGSGFYSLS